MTLSCAERSQREGRHFQKNGGCSQHFTGSQWEEAGPPWRSLGHHTWTRGAGAGGLEWTVASLAGVPLLRRDRPGGEKHSIPAASGPGITKDRRVLNQDD